MANAIHTGSQGVVYIGAVAVASIRSFSFEETQETVDATVMNPAGVAFRSNKATFKSWSGTLDVYWTTDDVAATPSTEGGAGLSPGSAEVTIHFWPTGNSEFELGYTGNALITSRTISSSVDGMVEASVSVVGVTALAIETKA